MFPSNSLRRPAVHFVLLGAIIFGLSRWSGDAAVETAVESNRFRIAISADDIARLRRQALARTGRLPGEEEIEALIGEMVAEEVLFREALALGLGEEDAVVRRRLVRNMRFVDPGSTLDDEALYRRAIGLGMERSDLVVRRRLIQRMRLAIEGSARQPEPTREELQSYLRRHRERFVEPAMVRLTHIFFSPERRGEGAQSDARRLLMELGAAGEGAEHAAHRGDAFLVAADLPLKSERALAKLFGSELAAAAMAQPPGQWSGPLQSSHGLHLVWVHEKRPPRQSPFDRISDQLRHGVLAEREKRRLREAIAALRTSYEVQVARPPQAGWTERGT